MERNNEKIDAYLNGDLSGEELSRFEKDLSSDESLAQDFRLWKEVDLALHDQPALEFQKMVEKEGARYLGKNKAGEGRLIQLNRLQWAIAASILILIVSAVVWWNLSHTSTLSGPELFAEHYQSYPLSTSSLRGEESSNQTFNIGVNQYQQGDFGAASQTFQDLAKDNEQDMEVLFYLGNAYLNQTPPQLDEAKVAYQQVLDQGLSVYVPASQWYLALIYLRQENTAAAKTLLELIVSSNNTWAEQASQILGQLE